MINVQQSSPYSKDEKFVAKVQQLDACDLDFVIERLKTVEMWTHESAVEARDDFIKFVSLSFILDETEAAIPSKAVDGFWHSFLLFSRKYSQWCESIWGAGGFLHHEPGHRSDGSWERTVSLVGDTFGELNVDWKDQALSCYTPPPRPAE